MGKNEEVSTAWLYRREKYPKQGETKDAAPTGSWKLRILRPARNAAHSVCPIEFAGLAEHITVAKS